VIYLHDFHSWSIALQQISVLDPTLYSSKILATLLHRDDSEEQSDVWTSATLAFDVKHVSVSLSV
jgi:hypothetical protein